MSFLSTLLAGLLLTLSSRPNDTLAMIKANGELKVLTRPSLTTYYEGPTGPTGFEYDLVLGFADSLQVRLRIVTAPSTDAMLTALQRGDAHLAAAGVKATQGNRQKARFGPTYQTVQEQLVHRRGSTPPRTLQAVTGKRFRVAARTSHAATLNRLRNDHPELSWQESTGITSSDLLNEVWQQALDYTIVDSHEMAVSQSFYPELQVAFNVGEPRHLAWAFPLQSDSSLYLAALRYLNGIRSNGRLEQLLERYYGHVEDFDYVGTRRFLSHVRQRLPQYLQYFQAAAEQHRLDWRLLAALGYQESHWNPKAVSPTGVRGIMMLTRDTAEQVGIKNRHGARESINGGARYFATLKARISNDVAEPDRTWFALAAYNVGLGHLEDARWLAKEAGAKANRWLDVKKFLPLLSKPEWHEKTRYGYARGTEPVNHVQNIRRYYDLLVRENGRSQVLAAQ
nr:membrane-bound lytic murein transglycosylase MltF [Gammaproteobacteria bacterium]